MKLKIFLLLFLLFSTTAFLNGQQVSTQPILRIETGTHIGKISRVSVDTTGTYLVTASEDKTARVWELASGKLLSILRPPIGTDNEGKIFAVSISPDGNTIAAGGWTGYEWDKANSIYLFDRESGRITKRISNLPKVIQHLEYSPDGKYLGVMLGEEYGIRLYETGNYQVIGEDRDYTVRGEFLSFDSTGKRLITSSFDGFLRLYEINEDKLRLVKKQAMRSRGIPVGVKFSPDGASIAVGFADTLQVKVLSAADLSVLYEPDLSKVDNGELSVVAWSADGRTLYAVGRIGNVKTGINSICYWTNDGRNFGQTNAAVSSVFDIKSLPGGGIVFGGANPAFWGTLDIKGERRIFVDTKAADFNRSFEGISVNEDATQFRFANQRYNKLPMLFSVIERKLEIEGSRKDNLKSPRVESNKLKIVDWRGTNPALNGRKLSLVEFENSHSLAILPGEKTFLLGTGWFLRLYDSDAEELWRVPTPSDAKSVNTDKNGKIVIVMYSDGTVRWYRISDGKELLVFFSPNDNTGRWILWTPSGYYDASPDAEDLIGWHVNNGKDAAADFFPNHLFRAYFYRPDIIDRVLQTADESLAIKFANKKANRSDAPLSITKVLPPVIEFNSPKIKEVSDTTVKLSYKIRNHSGEPITGIRTLIDGREEQLFVGEKLKTSDGISELTIQVPKKDSELILIAENKFTKSLPAKINLKWRN
jgi:WD40 repeat protein